MGPDETTIRRNSTSDKRAGRREQQDRYDRNCCRLANNRWDLNEAGELGLMPHAISFLCFRLPPRLLTSCSTYT